MSARRILTRTSPAGTCERLIREGVHPVIARVCAARDIGARVELDDSLAALAPPDSLKHIGPAAALISDAIESRKRIVIVADYDCDGATACAVGMRALRAFGADVGFIVPDRFRFGYGLTPEITALAAERGAQVIVTVDNGIASLDGVDAAERLGIPVVITDHHLPGELLPRAAAIVNPNQPDCGFPSKHLAGVGVMFYVMSAVRAELRRRGAFGEGDAPNLGDLLDLVALGTVADMVRLDQNNRALVAQGLRRIRAGRVQPGVRALFAVAGRTPARAGTFDLGYVLAPRLNAAGRLEDMSTGVECLITEDDARALSLARALDDLNRARRAIEATMQQEAEVLLADIAVSENCSLALFDPRWHQGVIGILAGRVKERHHRPVVAFAQAGDGTLRGSGRSIPGVHLRDALDLVAKRAPGLVIRFGGHAAAAGLTIPATGFADFAMQFEQAVSTMVTRTDLERVVETDGSLEAAFANLDLARLVDSLVWGQGFPPPLFCDDFAVVSQRVVGAEHLKLRFERAGRSFEAMRFRSLAPLPERVRAAYRLSVNEFNGAQSLQLIVEHWEPVGGREN